jgi:hypothetical protein
MWVAGVEVGAPKAGEMRAVVAVCRGFSKNGEGEEEGGSRESEKHGNEREGVREARQRDCELTKFERDKNQKLKAVICTRHQKQPSMRT